MLIVKYFAVFCGSESQLSWLFKQPNIIYQQNQKLEYFDQFQDLSRLRISSRGAMGSVTTVPALATFKEWIICFKTRIELGLVLGLR